MGGGGVICGVFVVLRTVANFVCSADDLINEEDEVVQKALKRLPPKVSYDRVYRMRRAMQVGILLYAVLHGMDEMLTLCYL